MSSKMKLPKSLSLASLRSPELKDRVMDDVAEAGETMPHYFKKMTIYTLRIVDINQFPDNLAYYLRQHLLDEDIEEDLTKSCAMNWCRTIKKLYPLKTRGDGNCLLHAVSLAMWGIHDSSAFLRRLLLVSLVSDGQRGEGKLFKRWKRSRLDFNRRALEGGIDFNADELDSEWQEVITAASDIKNPSSVKEEPMFHFLEDIHIFALTNILRRPIIILADAHVRSLSGAAICSNQVSGIYLPLLWSHRECVKFPIVLGYANNHFTPLIEMDDTTSSNARIKASVVPLVTKELESLNVHFLTDSDEKQVYKILRKYLHTTEINWTQRDASVHLLPCAKLEYLKVEGFDLMRDYVSSLQKVFRQSINKDWLNGLEDVHKIEQLGPSTRVRNIDPVNGHRQSKPTDKKEAKILNISSTEENDLCVKKLCHNTASSKYHPYCSQHKRKRSNSATSIEAISHCMKELNTGHQDEEAIHKRNSLNGKHENLGSKPCMVKGCKYYGLEEWGYHCSEHKRRSGSPSKRKNAALNTEWQKCRSHEKDCKKGGNSRYKGLCEQCYLKAYDKEETPRQDLTNTEILDRLPPGPIGEQQTQLVKCKEENCRQLAMEYTLGYCGNHFIERYRYGLVDIPTQEEILQYKMDMKRRLRSSEEAKAQSSPQTSMKHQDLCITPSCEGIRCKNAEGFCFECKENDRSKRKLKRQQEFEEPETSGSDDLVESVAGLSSSNDSDTCHAPGCFNKGKVSYRGLCLDCYMTLSYQRNHPHSQNRSTSVRLQTSNSSPVPSKMPSHRCKTKGCDMFGTEPNMGYCSRCFSDYRKVVLAQSEQLGRMSEAEQMRLLPLDRSLYPRKCVSCDNEGKPEYRGFCSRCAENRGMFCHPEPGVTSFPVIPRPSSSRATENSTSEVTTPGATVHRDVTEYRQVMGEVERSCRSSHVKCKNSSCANFANLQKQGYCNQCYIYFG